MNYSTVAMAAAHSYAEASRSHEQNVRVEDYLNDKLQTYADLENIDVLLRNVLEQQSLLQQQVRNKSTSSHVQIDDWNSYQKPKARSKKQALPPNRTPPMFESKSKISRLSRRALTVVC